MRDKEDLDGIQKVLILLIILGGLGAIIGFFATLVNMINSEHEEVATRDYKDKYCQEIGYDGVEGLSQGYYCYKDIPHESGVGTKRIYTGRLE